MKAYLIKEKKNATKNLSKYLSRFLWHRPVLFINNLFPVDIALKRSNLSRYPHTKCTWNGKKKLLIRTNAIAILDRVFQRIKMIKLLQKLKQIYR